MQPYGDHIYREADDIASVRSTDAQMSGGERHVLESLLRLRQHQQDGRRSPHKPLLALLALARI